MTPPRLLADEMLGRLARYLRMLGCDTEYVRGVMDEEILRRARAEARVVLTRDRQLARRAECSVLISDVGIADQLRQLAVALPDLPRSVTFDRCTVCNGPLALRGTDAVPGPPATGAAPPAGVPVFQCEWCAHRYWEGSHTAAVRHHLAEWLTPASP